MAAIDDQDVYRPVTVNATAAHLDPPYNFENLEITFVFLANFSIFKCGTFAQGSTRGFEGWKLLQENLNEQQCSIAHLN